MHRFTASRFGWVALVVEILQVVVVWGALGIVWASGLWGRGPLWLEGVIVYSNLAGLAGVGVAVAGLVKDSRRTVAVIALFLGVANTVLCGLPLVSG